MKTILEPQVSAEQESLPKRTILLAEDDESISQFLTLLFEDEGCYQVITVASYQQALEAIQKNRPQFLLTDYSLPGGNGIELAEHLHVVLGVEKMAMVVMSARREFRKEATASDIRFFDKPFDIEDLLEAVQNAFSEEEDPCCTSLKWQ
jgi:DNA-binding NtrC family response regulator